MKRFNHRPALDTTRGFTEGEWLLLRAVADGLEWTYGWSEAALQRLLFLRDFGYVTGLRVNELARAVLGDVRIDERDDHWLHVVGKGGKPGTVALLGNSTCPKNDALKCAVFNEWKLGGYEVSVDVKKRLIY